MRLPFEVGQLVTRKDLHDQYGGQRQGGISTPAREPFMFLFTGDSGLAHGYQDSWDALRNRFLYYGEGQRGDQQLTYGNLAIAEHEARGKALLLFRGEHQRGKTGTQARFLGRFRCDSIDEVDGVDTDGKARKCLRFALEPLPSEGDDHEVTDVIVVRRGGFAGPEHRAKIEAHSMAVATEYYCNKGYEVTDVHLNASYDLHCTRGPEVVMVEVKGSAGSADAVIMTRNEVELILRPGHEIFVVSNILLDGDGCRGGLCRIIKTGCLTRSRMRPLAFEVDLTGLGREV